MARNLAALLTVLALIWVVALVTAPVALTRGASAIAAPAAVIYTSASRICHQQADRSFRMAGVQFPVCARCFGLYVSGALGAFLGWLAAIRRRSPERTRAVLAAAALPTVVTFGLEFAGLMPFSNAARFIAALPLGFAAGWIFVTALREEGARGVLGF